MGETANLWSDGGISQSSALARVLWYYGISNDTSALTQKIVCPFHGDVNPSLQINVADGTWHCFGCNRGGDAKRFVIEVERKYHNLNDLQACIRYQKILKSKKCQHIVVDPARIKREKKPDRQLYAEAYDYYHGLRTVDWLHDDTPEVKAAYQYMYNRGFGAETLNKAKAKVTYNSQYGLIFPILDNGKFKGWVCRTMRKDIEAYRKYLYNKGFSRATTMCGEYGKHDWVIAVEGYMDRLKFVQNGITNVVAVLGWKMSKQQEEKLKAAGVKHVISALDNDECGKKGTQYLKVIFGPQNVTRWRYLKGIKDPGEMAPETFKRMYKKTMDTYRGSNV